VVSLPTDVTRPPDVCFGVPFFLTLRLEALDLKHTASASRNSSRAAATHRMMMVALAKTVTPPC
jgi:hypothetical protein